MENAPVTMVDVCIGRSRVLLASWTIHEAKDASAFTVGHEAYAAIKASDAMVSTAE